MTGDDVYAAGMAALALGLTLSATILLIMGRVKVPRPAKAHSLPAGSEETP